MKILAFSDIHEDYGAFEVLKKKAHDADFIVCAGDMSIFGNGIEESINMLDNLGKKVFCVHGNHDSEHKMKKLCEKTANVIFIHEGYEIFGDVLVAGYGGGGFSRDDSDFDKYTEKMENIVPKYIKIILLTHAPPYGVKLDMVNGHHVGSRSIRKFIEKYSPSVAVSGHIHETFRKTDKINKTVVVNPGPEGAMIIM